MYKLNITAGTNKKYTALIKKRFFKKLWLVVASLETDSKQECKQFYKAYVH